MFLKFIFTGTNLHYLMSCTFLLLEEQFGLVCMKYKHLVLHFNFLNEIIKTSFIFLPDSPVLSSNMRNDQDRVRELESAVVKETEDKMIELNVKNPI